MNWDQRYEELDYAIFQAKMDASNVDLLDDDEKLVKHQLKQAYEHLAFTKSQPDKREEHVQAGFDYVGKARGILGESPVQSHSFRRYQWPFLPPGMD
ncbi:MAG TPA: hypothetical protein VKO18_19475 [Terriglobia bacterium]|nr:hypothetical protein [Terriglobia bacterium]